MVGSASGRRAIAAVTSLLFVALAGCTSQPVVTVATVEQALAAPTSTAAPGDPEFRSAGLVGVDGTEFTFPDPAQAITAEGDGRASCPPGLTVAVLGPATGPDAPQGKPIMDAAGLAVTRFDAANPGCRLTAKQFDTGSSDVGTIAAAKSLVADPSVLATIGPIYSDEMSTAGDALDGAGFVIVTPSATAPGLAAKGWGNFVRGVPDDDQMAAAGANYLTKRLGYQRICVVGQDDGLSANAAAMARKALGDDSLPGCALTVGDEPHLNAAVLAIADTKPQAVYFTGFAPQAAALLEQLRRYGVEATFMGWDGVFDEQFLTAGGDAVRGALVVRGESPATPELAARLAGSTGAPTALYAVEGYEIASIVTNAIASGAIDRAAIRQFFRTFSGSGSFRHYAWTDDGQLRTPELQLYVVD